MKKIKISLLGKVVIAIAAGILFGQFLPASIVRIFVTFNSLFGNFLSFSIPLIILGLVTPAIGELGKGAGKLVSVWFDDLFRILYLFQLRCDFSIHSSPEYRTGSRRKSRRFYADALLRSSDASINGRHDSFIAFLYNRSWFILY